jgi:hypothetical protein
MIITVLAYEYNISMMTFIILHYCSQLFTWEHIVTCSRIGRVRYSVYLLCYPDILLYIFLYLLPNYVLLLVPPGLKEWGNAILRFSRLRWICRLLLYAVIFKISGNKFIISHSCNRYCLPRYCIVEINNNEVFILLSLSNIPRMQILQLQLYLQPDKVRSNGALSGSFTLINVPSLIENIMICGSLTQFNLVLTESNRENTYKLIQT